MSVHPQAGTPPTLKTVNISDEPSEQWAAHVLDSVADGSSSQQPSQSAVSTPGLAMPGGYPHPHTPLAVDTEQIKATAVSALGTAKQYVETAGDTVAPYLPEGVAPYIPHHAQAPFNSSARSTGVIGEKTKGTAAAAAEGTRNVVATSGNTASSYTEQARRSSSSAYETVKEYVEAVGDKVAPYLPQGVAPYIPTTSPAATNTKGGVDIDHMSGDSVAKLPEERRQEVLPSHDDESHTPLGKSGGVGPLPGNASETGVALLPEERQSNSHRSDSILDQGTSGERVAKLPEERRQAALPSHDDESSTLLGKTGGVCSLPGHAKETGVAALPEAKYDKPMGQYPNYLNPNVVASGQGGKISDTSVAERNVPAPKGPIDAPSTHGQSADRNAPYDKGSKYVREPSGGADTDASTRALHGSKAPSIAVGDNPRQGIPGVPSTKPAELDHPPAVPEKPVTGLPFGSDNATTGHGHSSQTSNVNTSPTHPATRSSLTGRNDNSTSGAADTPSKFNTTEVAGRSPPKKAGFMDKLKGEVKVMSGKLGHNEQKVEEGRRLMGKN